MIILFKEEKHKKAFDRLALHPLQSWSWGVFREKLGQKVIRLGRFEGKKLVETAQFTVHRIPYLPWTVGYLPRGGVPSREMIDAIQEEAREQKCIFVKLEPNVIASKGLALDAQGQALSDFGLLPGKPLFTPFTFQVDLRKSEQELLAEMKPKTRYNIRVAEKHGVEVL